ncbi:hypothetical protein ACLB9Y_03385 [Chryseobacterium scophthalmum]|uniref:hypothetical protein n=1 Tax=Chryseobacterium scophthalmum TaxID=59733 RepID=UPI00398B7EF5
MKTILIFLTVFATTYMYAQQDDGTAKLNECKRYTIDLLKNNTQNDNLTNCLVSLAMKGGNYVEQYNGWMSQITQNSKEQLQQELDLLESQKQQATEIRKQSFNSMMDNVTQNLQNQAQQNSYQKKSSGSTTTRDCVNRPGYGCGQR